MSGTETGYGGTRRLTVKAKHIEPQLSYLRARAVCYVLTEGARSVCYAFAFGARSAYSVLRRKAVKQSAVCALQHGMFRAFVLIKVERSAMPDIKSQNQESDPSKA
eukprot:2079923-Rhodomonas_salina.1